MIDAYIERYIALRDLKEKLKKEYEGKVAKVNSTMEKLEHVLNKALLDSGVDRMGCDAGVVFFQKAISATVSDRTEFLQWLQETEQWQLADLRAAKHHIEEWKDANDDLPPGITWRVARVIRVNRS
jgi:hypothetical protein